MNELGDSKLLAEMQVMAAKARGDAEAISSGENVTKEFASIFSTALNNVDQLQQHSIDMKQKFVMGDPNVSLIDTMVASQKSSLAFDATVQVRNKLVQAYQDIMNMPI